MIELPLKYNCNDDDNISKELEKSFELGPKIMLLKDTTEWVIDDEAHIHFMCLKYGSDMMISFDVKLDDLELFAHSVIKSIEMIRRDYADVLSKKRENFLSI